MSRARSSSRYSSYSRYSFFPPRKSKGERIADADKKIKALAKKGVTLSPVTLEGSKIAKTFWGKAWCDNIESYRDYAYRLERGRSYVRSNSIIDLVIGAGTIKAQVMGSDLYKVAVTVKPVPAARWKTIRKVCAGKIGSLIELLRGHISEEVMAVMTAHKTGLFPSPSEIAFTCSCPDSATMCKHVAAAMYGIGHRLDTHPELLFLLRGVDTADLLASAATAPLTAGEPADGETLAADELADVFGVEMDDQPAAAPSATKRPRGRPKKAQAATQAAPPAKRPRGRPKKAQEPAQAAPPAKRPRGRPKKG